MRQFRGGNAFSISKTKYGGILFFFQTASTDKALALLRCRSFHHWYLLPPCVLISADLLLSHFPIGHPFPLGLAFFFYCAVIQKLYVFPVKTTKNNIKTTYFYMFFRHFFIPLISPQYRHVNFAALRYPAPLPAASLWLLQAVYIPIKFLCSIYCDSRFPLSVLLIDRTALFTIPLPFAGLQPSTAAVCA